MFCRLLLFVTCSAPTLDHATGRSGTASEALPFRESSCPMSEHRAKGAITGGNHPPPPAGKALF